ncbi:MAG: tetratricopeptide repeat protein [Candidatus Omnitrophica bacterium]|nr:tetratricopeptide repeat protein [Candidatus Omnitrophota bacterium]
MNYFKKNLAKAKVIYYPYSRQRDMKFRNLILISFAVLFFVAIQSPCFAFNSKEQAQKYRQDGYYAQQTGDLQAAIESYSKAISLNPEFAAAYNDLGITYETLDELDQAENSYLKCLEIDNQYLAAYTNLAFLYEKKSQYKKAASFWKKRAKLGSPDEYWTRQAKKNFDRLLAFSDEVKTMFLEEQADKLAKDVEAQKVASFNEKLAKSKEYFQQAKEYFNQKRYREAKDLLQKAMLLTPNDPAMIDYYKKAKKNQQDEEFKLHIQEGKKYYELGDTRQAREHFKDLLTVIPDNSNH